MKYEVGKTYTLTGDETNFTGVTLRDYYAGTSFDFPVEAVYEGVDFEGDLQFKTGDGWKTKRVPSRSIPPTKTMWNHGTAQPSSEGGTDF